MPRRSSALLCSLVAWLPAAHATPNDGITGSYVRAEFGRSRFGMTETATTRASDDQGRASKLFYGYRFDAHWGFELGAVQLGSFRRSASLDGMAAARPEEGRARSVFAVATGRAPLGDTWAALFRAGMGSGRIRGDAVAGGRNSPTFGAGVEYRPRPSLVLALNYDDHGRLADAIRARSLVVGLHFTL